MTSARKKRGSQTYHGLKALLLTGGMGASLLGARLIARSESSFTAQEPVPAETVEITPEPLPEFSMGTLAPIPTIVPGYVVQEPPPESTNAAPGNVPVPGQAITEPSVAESSAPAIPTAVSIGALPPIPQPPSGGSGGGNSSSGSSGNGSSSSGSSGSGGATSRSS
jgi:uncharacterized membrane protein YgcG